MSSSDHSISPELRELLGDIGKQSESALLSISRSDIHKVVERPDPDGIDRTAGRFTLAEREVLDGYRHEVARLITDRTVAALLDGTFEAARVYSVPGQSSSGLDRTQIESRAESLADHVPDEWSALLRRFADSSPDAYTALQASAVRLVPSGRHRYHLADLLHLDGADDASSRILLSLADDAPMTRIGSVAAEFAAGIAADAGSISVACRLYRMSTMFDMTRLVPCAGWLFQALRLGDQREVREALAALATTGGADLGALDQLLEWRLEARGRDEWSPSMSSRTLVDRFRRGAPAVAEKVFDVFE